MTGISTATVETLTAEVRVLMIGSRQVTLSVYKQLDVVPLHTMTPFGRVNPAADDSQLSGSVIRVVGADRDGNLVASWFSKTAGRRFYDTGGFWANEELAEQTWDDLEDLPLIVLAGLR